MNADEKENLTKRSTELRQELKLWEKEFASANNGRKASRDDIKAHPNISMHTGPPRLRAKMLTIFRLEIQGI